MDYNSICVLKVKKIHKMNIKLHLRTRQYTNNSKTQKLNKQSKNFGLAQERIFEKETESIIIAA